MIKKYKGCLGEFQYDDTEFKFKNKRLRYIGTETDGAKIKIPAGITNCDYMFSGCTFLVRAPKIPVGVTNCDGMFNECNSLVEAPEIPVGVTDCYSMFYGCSSLTKAPVIPTSVTDSRYMFCDCFSLQERPAVPDHLVGEQSDTMFHNCPDPTVKTTENDVKPEETSKTEQSDICSSCIHKDICANRKTYGEAITQYIADFGCKYYKE